MTSKLFHPREMCRWADLESGVGLLLSATRAGHSIIEHRSDTAVGL